jgi:hypothetical protein
MAPEKVLHGRSRVVEGEEAAVSLGRIALQEGQRGELGAVYRRVDVVVYEQHRRRSRSRSSGPAADGDSGQYELVRQRSVGAVGLFGLDESNALFVPGL